MSEQRTTGEAGAVLERLHDAMNRHDLDAYLACFDAEYRSEQPVHPDRQFGGREQVEKNWSGIFANMPDFYAELLRSAENGDESWAEWRWTGTRADGQPMDLRGVTIFGVRDGRLVWGRLYMEYVDQSGTGIDSAMRRMTTGGAEQQAGS